MATPIWGAGVPSVSIQGPARQLVGLEIKGIPELQAVLKQLGDQATIKMGGALFRQAGYIMTEARSRTPHDTGTLEASGHVEEPVPSGNGVSVQLGFGGDASGYAVIVHEDLTAKNFNKPGSGPKYLEGPMLEAAGTLEQKLAADLKFDVGR